MQIIFALFGLIWTYIGMMFCIAIFLGNDASWKLGTGAFAFVFGFLCFLAGIKSYRGGWPTIIGGSILVLDSLGFAIDFHSYQQNSSVAQNYNLSITLFIIGLTAIILGHRKHKRSQNFDDVNNKVITPLDRKNLLLLFIFCLSFGVLSSAFRNEPYYPGFLIFWGIINNFIAYWWHYNDKIFYKYKSSKLLNISIILAPPIFLPIYFFKSRSSVQAKYATSVFLAILTYAHNLMLAGGILQSIV